jgi:hypothetical protein
MKLTNAQGHYLKITYTEFHLSRLEIWKLCVQLGLSATKLEHNKTGNVLQRNIKARSCNQCCSGKAMSITQPECVYL